MENNQIQSMDNELLTRAILEMEIYLNSLNSRVSLTEHSNNQVLHQQTAHMNTITKIHKDLQELKTAMGKMNVIINTIKAITEGDFHQAPPFSGCSHRRIDENMLGTLLIGKILLV